ncbi:PDZ domain-containing protein [Chitinophaga tropicalis]|uniref:PDZ domain-containing protein n=1 Tax=Chitinophaga tropicalis TaxID=2683588 RepID=A0A7K1TYL1_9BACT|nr:PDZ domain-containing protein [Chitinophaga tropicalis]MVT06855.1 PDZ domain-containing protein [Chitinophaga tropicalis]
MNKLIHSLTLAGITCLAFSAPIFAQDQKNDKLGEYDEIVIKRNSNKDGKVTIEIKDGNILVDGEKMDAYKDGDISVYRRRIRPVDGNTFNFNGPSHRGLQFFNYGPDKQDGPGDLAITPGKAVLGVFTEKKEAAGATIRDVAKDSPAEKAGLKTGDVITRIDADKIEEPQDLFEKIGAHDPGDKVTVTYLRDKKENTVTVTLDERKGVGTLQISPRSDLAPDNNFFRFNPGLRSPRGQRFGAESNDAKLGLSVQDTEDGKGAVVLEVLPGSAAEKAGFKKNDIITELAGTDVNSTRDVAETYRENKGKSELTATVTRNGQKKTLQVKVPKKLHKADL